MSAPSTITLQCPNLSFYISRHQATIDTLTLDDLPGTWTSTRCETRPGPQFVLRRHTFNTPDSPTSPYSVFGAIFHYADPSCSFPLKSVVFSGLFTPFNKSLLTPGATNSNFHLKHTWIHFYRAETAMKTWENAHLSCEELGNSTGKNYPVYTAGKSAPCLESLNLSFWEFQLFRLEKRRSQQPSLLLGDLHTDQKKGQKYRPTSYQPFHLTKYKTKHHTMMTRLLHNSSPDAPPHLKTQLHIPLTSASLMGTWHSVRCEVRPHTLFLIRKIKFLHGNQWEATFTFFFDHLCSNSHFSVDVSGRYIKGTKCSLKVYLLPRSVH